MLALRLTTTAQPPVLEDVPAPPPEAPGVHGRVRAATINPSDILRSTVTTTAENAVIGETPVPRTVGTEAVLSLPDGRRVYAERALVPYGTLAEQAVARPDAVFDLPDGVSDADAVASGIAGLAGWTPVATLAELRPGEAVLVLGATGASGRVATAAARLLGAGRVVAAGRRRDELATLCAAGCADAAVALTGVPAQDAEALRTAAGSAGYDVVIDYLFGAALEAALPATARFARVVCVGMSAGTAVQLNGMDLLVRGVRILPYSNVLTPHDVRAACHRDLIAHVAAGRIPLAVERYSLHRAPDAWARQAAGAPGAKLVVVPEPGLQ